MNATVTITRILVPTDFSPPSQVACHLATRLAGHLQAGLVLFHAVSGMELLEEMGRAKGKTQEDVLDDLRDRLQDWGQAHMPVELREALPVEVLVVVGEPAPAIAPAAKRTGADLIVMGTHGRTGLSYLLLGSVTEAVLRSIPVPVLALRLGQGAGALTTVKRILWATDLSPVSEGAWHYAITLAAVFDAEVFVLHVVRPDELPWVGDQPVPAPGSWLEEYVAPLDRELEQRQHAVEARGLGGRRKVVVGEPAEVIVTEAQAEEVDLIVVGTRGRTGLPNILVGSVAQAVIQKAPCPVLAVHVLLTPDVGIS